MGELIECDHVPIRYGHPNHHTAYDDPPRVQHKLPWGDVQVIKKFHNEWMDGKSEATQERNLIKANLTMGKGTSLLALPGKTSPDLIRELEPIPKLDKDIGLRGTLFLEGMKRTKCGRSKRERRRRYEGRHEGSCVRSSPIRAHIRRQTPLWITRSHFRPYIFPPKNPTNKFEPR